jgi:hypothetical protein
VDDGRELAEFADEEALAARKLREADGLRVDRWELAEFDDAEALAPANLQEARRYW